MTVAAETGLWQLDHTASTVSLRHKTMWGLVTVTGSFKGLSGQGEVKPDGTAQGTVTLDAASLDTRHTKRDRHLSSADFFDADRHPEITFTVHSVEARSDDTAQITGQLTIRGISRPQSFTTRVARAGTDAVTLDAEFTVDREEFGMSWNQMGMMRGLTTVIASLRLTRRV
ncbi:YceI family protein [Streptomyces chiangmaiensis]|uniref:YceI family protein n=1 Tax=Streptomyces chiangmaiensis TaxID=766497 RepID=A0ABU7FUQ2_9ACTN|nr:YceI family protein [Streptomyces chiangmaiensis]MED7827789.1 YceI family protein [Streptomyces chiangmaiensis]